MKRIIILSTALFFTAVFQADAQRKTVIKNTSIPKYKVPKISTLLGQYKDSIALPVEEVINIIGLPLNIVDVNKQSYSVTHMQFLYKKVVVSETEDGKAIPATGISSQSFSAGQLSPIWVSTIKEQLRKGEELYFFDIIVKDKQGRVMYAPTLKITIL